MGTALWAASGLLAFFSARIIPYGRMRTWLAELIAAVVTALLCGLIASYLDFGGWQELDWRAGLFAFFGAMAAVGALRTLRQTF